MQENMITLSLTLIENAEEFADIERMAFQPLYEKYRDEDNPCFRNADNVINWLSNTNRTIFNICLEKQIIGGIIIDHLGESIYCLLRIFVKPNMQNKGIAQMAIKEVEKLFPNAKKWVLDFPVDMPQNKKCYENCGYSDTGLRERINDLLELAIYEKVKNN